MATISPVTAALVALGSLAVVTTVPYLVGAIEYRRRDNGLAFLLLVSGVGVWNAMIVVQLLSSDPVVKMFFLGLSVVGGVLAGLGWFLFATTASSTTDVLSRSGVFGAVGVLGGLNIVLAVTTPVHEFYWLDPGVGPFGFATVTPAIGYWLHTGLLGAFFSAGAWLFGRAWFAGINVSYSRAYAIVGTLTAFLLVVGNIVLPGGIGVAAIVAAVLTTIGWVQASRGAPIARLRAAI